MSSTVPPPAGHRRRWHPARPASLLAVATGGAVGSLLRWLVELALPLSGGVWATLLVNVLGSAALAVLVVHGDRHPHPRWLRPGVGTGLLGGFTTFSTFAVQAAVLGAGGPGSALAYVVATPVLCVAATSLAGTLTLRAGEQP